MIKWFFHRQIAAFERAWNYDSRYVHDLIDTDPRAFMALGKVMGLSQYHKDIPTAAHFAAKIVGVMAEDCGPCTQLAIDMAERAGVDPAILRAVVVRDFTAMPYDVALATRFAEKTLAHAPEADDLREEVVRMWGKRALIIARIRDDVGQAVSDAEIRAGSRPLMHPSHHRGRDQAGVARADQGCVIGAHNGRASGAGDALRLTPRAPPGSSAAPRRDRACRRRARGRRSRPAACSRAVPATV